MVPFLIRWPLPVCYQLVLMPVDALRSIIWHFLCWTSQGFCWSIHPILSGSSEWQYCSPALQPSFRLGLFIDVMMMYFITYPNLLMKTLNIVSSSTDPGMVLITHLQLDFKCLIFEFSGQRVVLSVFHPSCGTPIWFIFPQFCYHLTVSKPC